MVSLVNSGVAGAPTTSNELLAIVYTPCCAMPIIAQGMEFINGCDPETHGKQQSYSADRIFEPGWLSLGLVHFCVGRSLGRWRL
jgi:hypothetical protein